MTYTQADLHKALTRKGSRLSQDPDGSLHKVCLACQERKPVSEFWKERSTTGLAWSSKCGACLYAPRKKPARKPGRTPEEARKRGNERARAYSIKQRFGLTVEEYDTIYDRLFEEQRGLCAICGMGRRDTTRRMPLDHCHETGKIRGLLCNRCNRGIGGFSDRLDLIQSAAGYLTKYA